jgi:probable DNA metabolism protein
LQGYREGGRLCFRLGDAATAALLNAEKRLLHEAHLLKGFARFSDVGGVMASVIAPQNYILPFIARHFILRYDKEQFIIFDKTNKAALIYQDGRAGIRQVDNLELPELSEDEAQYRALWKRFYNTIAISGRETPRCRMSHMPKRYWENMLEVSELVQPVANDPIQHKFR